MARKTKAPKEYRVVVYLSKAEHDALVKIQEATGAPFSEIIRRAIAAYIVR